MTITVSSLDWMAASHSELERYVLRRTKRRSERRVRSKDIAICYIVDQKRICCECFYQYLIKDCKGFMMVEASRILPEPAYPDELCDKCRAPFGGLVAANGASKLVKLLNLRPGGEND